jgi:hypothetical protein
VHIVRVLLRLRYTFPSVAGKCARRCLGQPSTQPQLAYPYTRRRVAPHQATHAVLLPYVAPNRQERGCGGSVSRCYPSSFTPPPGVCSGIRVGHRLQPVLDDLDRVQYRRAHDTCGQVRASHVASVRLFACAVLSRAEISLLPRTSDPSAECLGHGIERCHRPASLPTSPRLPPRGGF